MISVYQIVLTNEQVNDVNNPNTPTPDFYERYLNTTLSPKPEAVKEALDAGDYEKVADVSTDDLETSFMMMNRWSEVDEKCVRRLAPLHSMSVGDIVIDNKGKRSFVAGVGFEEV